ncbi:GRAM domain-containing protein 2B isoform X2 [Callorhinchus milii]|uniref:GRAM domain-containing protein 2B isoform X2 n=1 Tax=Callorhinchus milii TaxID=7868 RepID=UPI001C3F7CA7|nr:GRAM domain-containing protein 2B isoform X2 [Callorhinchus milii]XP_042198745.1 GRAM domain-containing protein 2B isoform X2 [Callorhinchus milii]
MKLSVRKLHLPEVLSNHQKEVVTMRKKSKKKAQSVEEESVPAADEAPLRRSKTFDSIRSEDDGARPERKKSMSSFEKKNAMFHKLFKLIPPNEDLTDCFHCALHREVPYHGKMYISENFVCFYSSILKETKVEIPVTAVAVLKKQNTALLLPNALSVRTTDGEKFLFASFRSRELSFHALKRVCVHLEDGSVSNSPMIPSPESSFGFSSQRLMESSYSSSERRSQEESESVKESVSSDESEVKETDVTLVGVRQYTELDSGQSDRGNPRPPPTGVSWLNTITKCLWLFNPSQDSSTIKTLILIYMFLVLLLLLSSVYIGWRLVALEEQLMSMGAWPQLHTHSESRET